jgi:hypothetical protein
MGRHSRAYARLILMIGPTLCFSACNGGPPPILIEKYCVSDSGLSKIWLTLNTSEKKGTIRYQYRGQDIRYVVKAMQIDGRMINGSANFQDSSTGETRGTPFTFRYESSTDTLRDGIMSARCQNVQSAAS